MKKLSIFLVVAMLASVFSVKAFANNNIPVSAELSETADGNFRIVVYAENPEKLVSFFTLVEYDMSLYSLEKAEASSSALADGERAENLSGMWVFGNLADKTGSVGAFVSYNGFSKVGRIAACEFIIHPETSRKNAKDIRIYVKEYITDDGDEENDIYKKTPVSLTEADVDISGKFQYFIGETTTITSIKTNDEIVFIPENIDGVIVRSLVTEAPFENSFIVCGRNVLRADKGVFKGDNTVISPVGSAPEASVKLSEGKWFSYNEDVAVDLKEPVFYTHQYLVNSSTSLFEGSAQYTVNPSHKTLGYLGTNTEIIIENGGKKCTFALCVMGDINGDSVCDVLDTMLCERYVNSFEDLNDVALKSTEFTGDGEVDVHDYAQMVNLSLGDENLVFEGVRGDLNGDYVVDVLDAFAFNKLLDNPDISVEEKAKTDFNNDGKISSADADILQMLIESFH